MFIQVIRGRVKDAAGVRKELDRWNEELRPGAKGFLGATSGITDGNELITLARFDSEAAARSNSDRPEQGQWYQDFAQHLDGEPQFWDCTECRTWMGGGSDDAGFVQIITGRVKDPKRATELWDSMDDEQPNNRPDVMGGVVAIAGDRFFNSVYFTSEKEARAGEQAMGNEPPEEMQELMSMTEDMEYLDLHEPVLE
jgi:hypothetical protein